MSVGIEEVRGWLQRPKAPPLVYHVGNLMYDRAQPGHHELDFVAAEILNAAAIGVVTLVQQRLDDGICSYIARKRAK